MSQHVMFNAVLSSHPALFIQGEWRIVTVCLSKNRIL